MGYFGRAKTATEATKVASVKEEIELEILDEILRANSENNEFNYDNVWNELEKKDKDMSVIENEAENNYTVVYKGYNFLVDNQIVTHIEGPIDPSQTTSELIPLGETTVDGVTYTQSYDIWNKGQLETFRNRVNDGETFENCIIRQKANINLNNENWNPIGDFTNVKTFNGTFDAEGKTTRGLNINEQKYYQGLFGYVKEGTIKRLTVEGSVTGGTGSAGIVGLLENGEIDKCTNKVNVSNTNDSVYLSNIKQQSFFIGGICGLVNGECQITDSSNEGKIEYNIDNCNYPTAGGIVGLVNYTAINSNIENCTNLGEIKVNSIVATSQVVTPVLGGIVGTLWEGKISKCNNIGRVYSIETNSVSNNIAFNMSGGIVGSCTNTSSSTNNKIEKCWNNGEIENTIAGGIVGVSTGYIVDNCYNAENIKSNYKCGVNTSYWSGGSGICEANNGIISNCYNKGEIENNGYGFLTNNELVGRAAGITAGNGLGSVTNCYNKGAIKVLPSAEELKGCVAGGVVGQNCGNILNVYNEGSIETNGNSYVIIGGVAGWEISNNYTRYVSYVYNIGKLNEKQVENENSVVRGGVLGISRTSKAIWQNYYWLEGTGAIHANGELTSEEESSRCTSEQIKGLISSGGLPDTDWAIDSNINSGYPHLKIFDDTSIWLRDNNINDGDPYLKENLP